MDERLEERLVDTFVPIVEIEAIIGESVTHKRYTGTQIRRKSCSDYNFAIERSLLHTGCSVPDRFLFVWEETTFFTKLNRYLEKEYLKGNSPVAGVPGEQIEYVGSVGKHAVYDLHLANVYLDELYISYLFLQNPKQTSYAMTTVLSPDYKGLGNGIFDQILTNVEEHARSFGYGRLALHAANETLRDIYLRRGFETDDSYKQCSILMTKKM